MGQVCLFLVHKTLSPISERIHGTNVPVCHSTDFLDLVPSDFYLFLKLKKKLRGMWFQLNEEVEHKCGEFFLKLDLAFYAQGISKPISLYDKYVNVDGSYVEK